MMFGICRQSKNFRWRIGGSDRGSNFYETKFMDCSSRWEENRQIWSRVYGKRQHWTHGDVTLN